MLAVTASLGQQKSSSESRQDQTTAQGSTLGAGRDLSITATGNGEAGQGDINVQGSQLKAARDVTLDATHDFNLTSSENTSRLSGSNKSSGGSIGVSVGTNGATLNLSANQGKGRERGDGVTHNETQVDAGRTVSLNVGNNALLRGAQVNGEKIVADIAHNLTLQSEQDHDHYDSKQQNVSGGLSIPIAGAGAASGSMNMSRTAMNSDYDSVQAQTGLFAGKGGFDVKVGDHTQLNGAALSSTADADKNRLDTGTLGFSDIANHAEYKVDQQSTGISSGAGSMGDLGKQLGMNMAATTLTNLNGGDSASSTTHAAVSDGTINVRNADQQTQDIATLSRDTEHANNALTPIFDKEKEQQRLARMQAVSDIGSQAMDIVRTQGQINAHKAAQEQVQAQEANNKLNGSDKQAVQAAYDHAYNQQMLKYGTGSSLQQGIQAATGALTALAGGDAKQAIAQGAAPYLAEQVKKATEGNTAANTIGHALVGGVVAELSGQNATAGATGAAAGELAARVIASQMFNGKDISELSESKRRQVSDLSTLAAGLAGGVSGDSTASTVAGAKAGQNAVENNTLWNEYGKKHIINSGDKASLAFQEKLEQLGIPSIDKFQGKYNACNGNEDCRKNARNEYYEAKDKAGKKLLEAYKSGNLSRKELNMFYGSYYEGYSSHILAGLQEGEKNAGRWNGRDIYTISSLDWTPAGLSGDKYLSAINRSMRVSELESQGLSNKEANESLVPTDIINSAVSSMSPNAILSEFDNGISLDSLVNFGAAAVINRATSGRANGINVVEKAEQPRNNRQSSTKLNPVVSSEK